MFKWIGRLRDIENEEKMLNIYLMISWGAILAILFFSYLGEVFKGAFSVTYFVFFVALSFIPYYVCWFRARKHICDKMFRNQIVMSYFIMYVFVLLTGHTMLVFTYIFPILTFLVLYHDQTLIKRTGFVTLLCNIAYIYKQYMAGQINVINSRDYEIQIALIILCFAGSYTSSRLYARIDTLHKAKEKEVEQLLVTQAVLEEEKKFAYLDYLTRLANRKKFDEEITALTSQAFEPFYLISIDINGLKQCNDTHGHLAGDELILGMAHCLQTAFNDETSEAFRLSGDEFSVISKTHEDVFNLKLEVLEDNMANWKGEYGYSLSAAIGYIHVVQITDYKEVLRLADIQMYKDKEKYYERIKVRKAR